MNSETARRQMIERQIRPWDVLDPRVLETLRSVPREDFVPEKYRELAFSDSRIPLAHDQVMMEPKVEGRLLQALDVLDSEQVLEIGTGSGFLCACLAKLAHHVDSLEIHEDLSARASEKLDALGVRNVRLDVADATRFESNKTYDAIAVTASAPRRLRHLEAMLKPHGRLFIIVGEDPVMEALLITRAGENAWSCESLFETSIPALVNVQQESRFRF